MLTTVGYIRLDLLGRRYNIKKERGKMDWTEEWRNINDSAEPNPAVYKIRLLGKDKKPIVISRWLGKDSKGIIYIGQNGNMEKRRIRFIKGFDSGGTLKNKIGHPAGNWIHILNKLNVTHIELKNLEYSYCETEEPEQFEREIIGKYVEIYGELPPFNSSFPKRKEWVRSMGL